MTTSKSEEKPKGQPVKLKSEDKKSKSALMNIIAKVFGTKAAKKSKSKQNAYVTSSEKI